MSQEIGEQIDKRNDKLQVAKTPFFIITTVLYLVYTDINAAAIIQVFVQNYVTYLQLYR